MEQMDYLLKVFLWNVLEYLTLLIENGGGQSKS